ncbi:LysR family transcriptional regulator [Luteibacter aegosomaticola]|uniref:LysR family transcriptional regulator n=1 Tax=Luteibacter aegosomaticola TaxID=2911538 RepID=UPI001FFA5083|nr:LysR family transcriptional regulator [Luteibacter aegosomaticola]UPG92109.1 LysR family transcriptional regulator [Luteibacter aegosomaticola]
MFSLNLRHLDALLAVARIGSMSGAAAAVNLSQPALVHAVAKLERVLDARLFERHAAGVELTESGRGFVRRVDTALRLLVRGVRRLRRAVRGQALAHVERRVSMAQLRALVAVVGNSSYAAAAEDVGVSEPALHRAMRELQEALEVPLLVRVGRSIRPTDAATRLVHFVRLMLAELGAAIEEIASGGDAGSGFIRIGVLPVARAHFLPRVLSAFASEYPAAMVEVIEGPYLELLARLRQGDMDLLIGSERQTVPARDVLQEGLFDDELVIVGRAGHPLRGGRLTTAALLRYPWVVPARGVPLRLNWERMFHVRGVEPPPIRLQCASVLIMRGMMLAGDWLTLMSRDQFLLESRAGHLVELGTPGKDFWRRIAMTRRSEWLPTPLQAKFVALLRRMAAEKASGQ